MLTTPLVFIIFNRPDATRKVFERIRAVRPSMMLVIADGPRENHPEDCWNCAAARAVIDEVDWSCEILTNFSDVNLGCRRRVSSGLQWVFENVEEAIILEDDCVPHPSFFGFCEELLDKYRGNTMIGQICGTNFQFGSNRVDASYYFSRYCQIWGWATWRRAWQNYDLEMRSWPSFRDEMRLLFPDRRGRTFWTKCFDDAFSARVDTWDHQWNYACWKSGQLAIVPAVNLVSNIGFTCAATHTNDIFSQLSKMPVHEMVFPLRHPPEIARHQRADRFVQKTIYTPSLSQVVGQGVRRFLTRFTLGVRSLYE